ncbi:MAG: toprim domain-containing protein [Oscillospiraceae bacterium]|nr:toprim domain-containing protein [Oscillospiraceae bacterium]
MPAIAKKTKNEYGDNSLKSLKGPDRVRKRPAVIFGSDGIDGCKHSVFEILSNSIDEAREGYGKRIVITKYADKSIEIIDNGRGIPIDFNKNEDKYNWHLAFCTLYAGGKYDNNAEGDYTFALGLNGLGLCSTQYAAEYMEVESDNGTWNYKLRFEKGYNVTEDCRLLSSNDGQGTLFAPKREPSNADSTPERGFVKSKSTGQRGTRIKWRPDTEVFTDIDVDDEYFSDVLRRQSIVNDGVEFLYRSEQAEGEFTESVFCYKNGIDDYLQEIVGLDGITAPQSWGVTERQGRDRDDKPDYKVRLKVAFAFTNGARTVEHYHNSSWLEYGGSPDKALRQAFVSQIDAYLKSTGKYNKGESKINFSDVEDCLAFISSNFSTQTSYENQTKKAISNKFIYETMTEWLKTNLEVYFLENKDDAEKIAGQIIVNKRSRENAEKTRLSLKKKLSGGVDIANRVHKFVDCRSKDLAQRELYIVEGDSALGAVKLARDAEYQAVIPVRGKILNCLKSGYDKIFKNEIITDIIKVLGCGVEVKSRSKDLSSFNIDNLRWSKVVICTDADVDGFQIRTLILTMLYCLTPQLITQGYVYIAESPLYEINAAASKGSKGGEETFFAYTEKEKSRIMNELNAAKGRKYTIQRSKGLGENEPDMMSLTTMNPETRRLIKVNPTDVERTKEMFDLLLGDNLQGRKDFISEYGAQYLEVADIS